MFISIILIFLFVKKMHKMQGVNFKSKTDIISVWGKTKLLVKKKAKLMVENV